MAFTKFTSKNEPRKRLRQIVASVAYPVMLIIEEQELSLVRVLPGVGLLTSVIEKIAARRLSGERKKLVEKILKLAVRLRRNLFWGSIILGLVASSAPMAAFVILGIAAVTGYDAWRIFQQ